MTSAEPAAYGLLGLLPWEFDRLTPQELTRLSRWAQWREDRQWELAAWMCANLMNASGNMKHAKQPSDLLGPHFAARQEAHRRAMTARDDTEETD